MKIILLRDVPKVGKKYEIKEVASGFAENALFKKGLAEPAIPKNLEKLKKILSALHVSKGIQDALLEKNFGELKEKVFEIHRKANDMGHLFSKIHPKDISELLANQHRIDIDTDAIILEEPIKTTGRHEVMLQVGNKKGMLILEVVGSK